MSMRTTPLQELPQRLSFSALSHVFPCVVFLSYLVYKLQSEFQTHEYRLPCYCATPTNERLIPGACELSKMVPELVFSSERAPATTAEDGCFRVPMYL